MKVTSKYRYHCRPEYGSENLLIHFLTGAEEALFFTTFLNCISEIHPKTSNVKNLWMNDEIVIEIQSDIGDFTFSQDTWGFAFILASENQNAIMAIDSILQKDSRFEKEEADFGKYKLK